MPCSARARAAGYTRAQAMEGERVHLTADEVHERARNALPEVSLATVYDTLNELVSMGEVGQVDGPGPTRYDTNGHRPHHHLVCLGCGELRDVYPPQEHEVAVPRGQRQGHRIVRSEILF